MPTLDCTLGIQSYPIRRDKRSSVRRGHPYPFTFRETPLFTPQDLLDEDEDPLSPTPSFHRSRSPSLDHRPLPDSARTSALELDPFYFAPSSPAKSSASSQASFRRSIAGRKSGPSRRSCVQRRRGEHRACGATFRARQAEDVRRPVFNPVNWVGAGDGARAQPTVSDDPSPTQPARSLKTSLSFILNAPDEEALWRWPWGSNDSSVPEGTKSGFTEDHPSAASETRPPSIPVSASSHPSECDDVVPPISDARFDAPIRADQCCFPKIPLPPLLIDLSLDDEGDLEEDGPLQLQYPDSASPHAESPEELTVPIARTWQANLEKVAARECEADKDGAGSALQTTGSSSTVAQAATGDRSLRLLGERSLQCSETTCGDLNDSFAAVKPNESPTDPFINATSTDYEPPKPDFALRPLVESDPRPLVESDPAVLGPAILVFNDLVDAPKGPGKKPRIPRDTKFALKVNARAKRGEVGRDAAEVKGDGAEVKGDTAKVKGDGGKVEGDAAKVNEDGAKVKEDAAKVEGTKAETRRPYYREEAEKEEAKKPCVVGPRIPEPVFKARKTKASAPAQTVTASALSSGDVKKGDSGPASSSASLLPARPSSPFGGPVFSATSEPFPATLDPDIRSRRGRPLRPQQREARARRDAMEQQKKAVLLAFRDAAAKARRRVGIFRAMVRAMEDTMGMEDVKWGRVGKVREVVRSQVDEGCLSVIDGGLSPSYLPATSSGQQLPSANPRVGRGPLHYCHGAKANEDRLLALAESALSASCQQEATSLAKTSSRASLESQSSSGSSHLGARPRHISLQAYLKRKRESASDSEGDNKRSRRG